MNQMLMSTAVRPASCLASARISTTKQMSGESLADQARALELFAKEKGWRVLPDGHAQQEIETATKRRRGYEEQIKYIRENPGSVGYYLIRYIDRFTRQGNEEYQRQKRELAELGVALIDTSGVIQQARNMPELEALGFAYDWSVESPSDLTEVMLSTTAKQERNTILKRIIPRQIAYTQQGYQIGRPDDGYINERIRIGPQKRFIQAPDPDRAHFIRTIFELRAEAKLTDRQIVEHLNDKLGYRTPVYNRWNSAKTAIIGQIGGNPLNEKQLTRLHQRTSYAGVICKRWTHYKPINAQWDGLVSIELWNQANRGKRHLEEHPDGSLHLLFDYQPIKPTIQRLRNNPDYPFKCIRCPECGKPLKGSAPKGKTKYYPRYHCERGHASFSVSRDQMRQTVETFLQSLDFDEAYFAMLKDVLLLKLKERQIRAADEEHRAADRVQLLKTKQGKILDAFITSESATTKQLLERQLEEIEAQIHRSEAETAVVGLTETDIDKVVQYARHIGLSPEKSLIDEENPLRQMRLFDLIFEEMPTYQELDSGTPKIRFVFNRNWVIQHPKKGANTPPVNALGSGWNPITKEVASWLKQVSEALNS